LVYRELAEKKLLHLFAHKNSERFSMFSADIFRVNIVAEQKQA